jgi:hypothetical protein
MNPMMSLWRSVPGAFIVRPQPDEDMNNDPQINDLQLFRETGK